ncbi:unnamed protein product [Choristocarpus tenellus]|uniref:Photosystem I reaction center subunit IV n=1 Tax=Choristocarpus tenellus TaxID=116065 RepID=UPI002E76BCD6|nr:Photosystem I reaction center subunit IV [Choristocarpus tenellus]WAM62300.1 Photosystem I reaction center subunit IV [Choristocarpus tenellus]
MLEKNKKVKIIKPESFWFRETGIITKAEIENNAVLVKFNTVNYSNLATCSYALDEVEEIV